MSAIGEMLALRRAAREQAEAGNVVEACELDYEAGECEAIADYEARYDDEIEDNDE